MNTKKMNKNPHQSSLKYKSLEPDWLFYGGTFDPPHVGHLDTVRFARNRFPDAEVVLIPAYAPPVSRTETKNVQASFPDRVAMCVVAFDEWDHVQVSSLEEDLDAPSYTVKTLSDLRAEYPTSRLAWMIGADQLATFGNWSEPRKILEMASLVVLPRPGQAKIDLVDCAATVATSLGFKVSIDRDEGVVLLDGAGAIFILNDTPSSVSSTAIRDQIAASGVGAVTGLVPDTIAAYIDDLDLYKSL